MRKKLIYVLKTPESSLQSNQKWSLQIGTKVSTLKKSVHLFVQLCRENKSKKSSEFSACSSTTGSQDTKSVTMYRYIGILQYHFADLIYRYA